jgi:hypothetical protein
MESPDIRTITTDAIGFWEPRRAFYNIALVVVVVAVFMAQWPQSAGTLSIDLWLNLFVLAVLANIAYCSAYLVELLAQVSAYREVWRGRRWMLLILGTAFACAVASFIARSLFGHRG